MSSNMNKSFLMFKIVQENVNDGLVIFSWVKDCLGYSLIVSINKDVKIIDSVGENGSVVKVGGLGVKLESQIDKRQKYKHI